jgi:hypothetical protein
VSNFWGALQVATALFYIKSFPLFFPASLQMLQKTGRGKSEFCKTVAGNAQKNHCCAGYKKTGNFFLEKQYRKKRIPGNT